MKKTMILTWMILLCFLVTACGQATPNAENHSQDSAPADSGKNLFSSLFGNNAQEETFDFNAEPEIVVNEQDVYLEELYDFDNNHKGYLKITQGSNCGQYGCVLLEFLDLNKNVVSSFSPRLPGLTLDCGIEPSRYYVWESDYNEDGVTANEYILNADDASQIYAYTEVRKGTTTRLDLYGNNGQVVATLAASSPGNQMFVDNICTDYYIISENLSTVIIDDLICPISKRSLYYSREDGRQLADFWITYDPERLLQGEYITRIESKDENGEVLRVYTQTMHDSLLRAHYEESTGYLKVYEYRSISDLTEILEELYDPQTRQVIFRKQHIYQDGVFSHTEMSVCGGKVAVTDGPTIGTFTKLEFYDPQGVLQMTVEAPEGGWLYTYWSMGTTIGCGVGVYNANGEYIDDAKYAPESLN